MGEFKDKVIVVTGASQGVGKTLAERFFREEGAMLGLLDIKADALKEVAEELDPSGKRVAWCKADVSSSEDVRQAIAAIGEKFGRIDILINNAGLLHPSTIEDSTVEHMDLMVGVNLLGPMYCTNAAVPYMKGGGGSIINVASILATFPNTGSGAYGAAKAGVITLTRVWAAELAPYGIRVNCYAPGVVNTEMAADVIQNRAEQKLQQIALRKFAETDDIYDLVYFYCSEKAHYITGQCIGIDGGIWITQRPTGTWKL